MPQLSAKRLTSRPALSVLAIACTLALSAFAHAETGVRLRTASSLSDSPALVNENTASFVSAEQMETTDDEIYLRGDAEIRRAGTVVRGDTITFTQSTDTVNVKGNAYVAREGARFRGPELSYVLESQSGEMQEVQYEYAVRGIRGQSKHAQFVTGEKTQLRDATITTCKPGSKAWWIEADTLTIDEMTNMATAQDASLHVAGLPVMGLPYAFFPVGTQRQSGLLVPSVGYSSDTGFDYSQPIYFNLAPNYDYTFTPRVLGKRGILLGNEFRFLTEHLSGQIVYDYMPHDRKEGESRYGSMIRLNGQWNGFNFYTNYNRVSDGEYLDDFSPLMQESEDSILPQDYAISYGRDFWSASLSVQKNQVLQREDHSPVSRPYEKVPQLNWRAYLADINGFEVSSTFEVTKFKHRDEGRVEGDRFYMQHSAAYPMRGAGWFITPKAMLTGIAYNLDQLNGNQQSVYDEHAQIVVPTFSLDAGLIFERDASWFGRAATQTLEPRIFYAYTPYRDQSDMPDFDTSVADLSFGSFFTENAFTGHDRVSQANQLTLMLTSRYLDRKSGSEFLRAAIGQRIYFDDQDVSILPGDSSRYYTPEQLAARGLVRDDESDYLGAISVKLTKDISASVATQYAKSEDRFNRINAGIRWSPKPSSIIGLYYRYDDLYTTAEVDRIKQLDFSVQWPITNRLYALARYNYALDENQPVEILGGIEYVADCWALRLVAQREVDGRRNGDPDGDLIYDNTYFIQLELTGLGGIGSNPIDTLRRSIPGYRATTVMPEQSGLYDYYE